MFTVEKKKDIQQDNSNKLVVRFDRDSCKPSVIQPKTKIMPVQEIKQNSDEIKVEFMFNIY